MQYPKKLFMTKSLKIQTQGSDPSILQIELVKILQELAEFNPVFYQF